MVFNKFSGHISVEDQVWKTDGVEIVLPERQIGKTLTIETTNPSILALNKSEYAERGPVISRFIEIDAELRKGVKMPFSVLIKANTGDAQSLGQKPMTFIRQVIALVTHPELLQDPKFPKDVKKKALEILGDCRGGSAGAYSDARGLQCIRAHVAEYIERRDGGIPSHADDIILVAGASEGIRSALTLFKGEMKGKKSGVMTPVPQFPLYAATLEEYNMHQIHYYLKESQAWSLETAELRRAIQAARSHSSPRAIVVINPGNPTGNVLTRKNMESIIKFAYEERLFILADEVYQDNIYEGSEFLSFKKVMSEMDSPYNTMELISFFSCSKGFACECGLRGGYLEMFNVDKDVKEILISSIAAKLCPTVLGQTAVDCIVDPPKPSDDSFELYEREKHATLQVLAEKARLVKEAFDSMSGIECQPIQGAMYAFPQIHIPEKAIEAAKERDLEPDVFYCLELLESTGISVVPGSGFGQIEGTYHFRTTILPPTETLQEMLHKFKDFQNRFLEKYSD